MKAQANFSRSAIGVGVATALLLMVPLVAMLFTEEVKWSVSDFLIMGALVYGTGISYMWLTRKAPNMAYRLGAALAFLAGFIMIWANLAVGLIGSGPNVANLLYAAVIGVGLTGIYFSRFKPAGMAAAMFVTVLALVVHTLVAFLAGMQHDPVSTANSILLVNGFFAFLFLLAGLVFRFSAMGASR